MQIWISGLQHSKQARFPRTDCLNMKWDINISNVYRMARVIDLNWICHPQASLKSSYSLVRITVMHELLWNLFPKRAQNNSLLNACSCPIKRRGVAHTPAGANPSHGTGPHLSQSSYRLVFHITDVKTQCFIKVGSQVSLWAQCVIWDKPQFMFPCLWMNDWLCGL